MSEPDDNTATQPCTVEDEAWRIRAVAPKIAEVLARSRGVYHLGRSDIPAPPLAPEIVRRLFWLPPEQP